MVTNRDERSPVGYAEFQPAPEKTRNYDCGFATAESSKHPNEDRYAVIPEIGLIAAADGISSLKESAHGAELAMSSLGDELKNLHKRYRNGTFRNPGAILKELARAFETANSIINKKFNSSVKGERQAGTTASVAQILETKEGPILIFGSLGNTRVAVMTDMEGERHLGSLTVDHSTKLRSLFPTRDAAIEAQGRIDNAKDPPSLGGSLSEAAGDPGIFQYLGKADRARSEQNSPRLTNPDLGFYRVKPGDRVVIYTDGLSVLTRSEIEGILSRYPNNQKAADELVAAARARMVDNEHPNPRSHQDDVTVVIMSRSEGESVDSIAPTKEQEANLVDKNKSVLERYEIRTLEDLCTYAKKMSISIRKEDIEKVLEGKETMFIVTRDHKFRELVTRMAWQQASKPEELEAILHNLLGGTHGRSANQQAYNRIRESITQGIPLDKNDKTLVPGLEDRYVFLKTHRPKK